MKIEQYLKETKTSQSKFCKGLEEATGQALSQGGLSKYVTGVRIPRRSEMKAIHQFTGGKVTPNDFFLD
tara:strand:+ start:955 stop:1161 length:207 start_codon:yes stop_codon:yes gene_type:complete